MNDGGTDFRTEDMTEPASETRQADSIPQQLIAEVDEAISHYPVSKRSAALPLLHLWQNHFGFIDNSGIEWIAAKLQLQPINIYELVTFYPWFRQQAAGRTIIRVCRTLSCALAGGAEVHERFCKELKLEPEHDGNGHGGGPPTTDDGRFSVEFVECLASCGTAPVCLVNDDLLENVKPDDVPEVLKQHGGDSHASD